MAPAIEFQESVPVVLPVAEGVTTGAVGAVLAAAGIVTLTQPVEALLVAL